MGRPPAVVIVARHGARLDAADEQWQTNSPSPYDSPLSYGGWTQTRALGARIASLLHARDAVHVEEAARPRLQRRQSDAPATGRSRSGGDTRDPAQRRTKVVIHTSPFLRCVQSSIAISAGMAQYHGNLVRLEERLNTPDTPKATGLQSRSQTLDSKAFEEKYFGKGIPSGVGLPSSEEDYAQPEFEKPTLRIDACLGEWLSPDYYDFTTSPPPSNMMVALAKAELLRSAEPLQGAKIFEPDGSVTEYPGGAANGHAVHHERPRSSTISMDDLARAIPVHSSNGFPPMFQSADNDSPTTPKAGTVVAKPAYVGYIPPSPTYALLHSASIPGGYVSHARDACIDIDFQWDSMREPQNWGDGGTFGEEWSAMHRRFRGGVANMVNWYKEKGPDFDPQNDEKLTDDDSHADDDTDVVLLIMTHGAGCNALIGALTNQPVLMDVGMGSLTMAVHKHRSSSAQSPNDMRRNSPTSFRRRRRSSVVDIGLSEEYDMKLMASTEHLRAGPDPLVIPQLAHPGAMPAVPGLGRRGSATPPVSKTSAAQEPEARSKNSSLGSMRRTSVRSISSRNFSPSPLVTTPTSSTGLWGSRGTTVDRVDEDEADGDEDVKGPTTSGAPEAPPPPTRHLSISGTPASATSARSPGLWGSMPTIEDTRRRYTVGMRR